MEQIWWERVPNAAAFTTEMIENLLSEKSIILHCCGDLPWYSYMVNFIKESVKQQNSSKRFESIQDVSEPGKYLLKEFCKQEKRAEYRPSKTYAQFFANSDDVVLHERYLWVKVTSAEQLEAWTSFVSAYIKERGKNKEVAVFIIEWLGNTVYQAKKGVKFFSLDEFINEYDRNVFCTLAASSVREPSLIKKYLTELAVNVVGNDIELCAACLQSYKEFLGEPYDVIQTVLDSEIRSNGEAFSFNKTRNDVDHLIWLAQIKTIYPLLEEYREDFVQRHSTAIVKQLPIRSSSGEIYQEPRDVELGTLKYMADNGQLSLSQKDYESLKKNRDARNKLSHLAFLNIGEIRELLKSIY